MACDSKHANRKLLDDPEKLNARFAAAMAQIVAEGEARSEGMQFRVGPWMYQVKLMEGLTDGRGSEVAGLCACGEGVIWINANIPGKRRLAVLLHELRHAWHDAFGRPGDDEGDADQAASFAADTMQQLYQQGGEWALQRLTPEGR